MIDVITGERFKAVKREKLEQAVKALQDLKLADYFPDSKLIFTIRSGVVQPGVKIEDNIHAKT